MTTRQTTQHTPGPWKWEHRHDDSGRLIAMLLVTAAPDQPHNDPVIMAAREDWLDYLDRNETGEADARLIAAAPKMLGWIRSYAGPCLAEDPDEPDTQECYVKTKTGRACIACDARAILRDVEG